MRASRIKYLEHCLSILNFDDSLRALDFVVEEMCAKKGFKRHDGSNYYYHLVDATQDLFNHGVREQSVLTACLLHDSVEDIEWFTIEEVERLFGKEVAIMVDLLTKKKGIDYKILSNLYAYLDAIAQHYGASLIKTADRKHNFSTLRHATRAKKLRQAYETEVAFIPFFKVCRKLYPRYANYFFSAKTAIEPHLLEIKERYEEVEALESALSEVKNILNEALEGAKQT